MIKLAERLSGQVLWNEIRENIEVTPGATQEKDLVMGIFETAYIDLVDELERKIDPRNPDRIITQYKWETSVPNPRFKGKAGRKPRPFPAPYRYFFSNSDDLFSFLWCCDHISSSPQYLVLYLRKQVVDVINKFNSIYA